MRDLLCKAASVWRNELQPYSYEFVLGRHQKQITLLIKFPRHTFYHAAGLQYTKIKGLENRNEALKNILSGKIPRSINESGSFCRSRLEGVCSIKKMIENNQLVFKYVPFIGSNMKGDFLIYRNDSAPKYMMLIWEKTGHVGSVIAPTLDQQRQALHCRPQYSTLLITRIENGSGRREEIFRRKTYHD